MPDSMTLAGVPVDSIHITPDVATEILRDAHASGRLPHHRVLDDANRVTEVAIGSPRLCWIGVNKRRGSGRNGVEDYPLMVSIPVVLNTRDNRTIGDLGRNALAVVSVAMLYEVPVHNGTVPPWLKDSMRVDCTSTTLGDIEINGLVDPDLSAVKAQLLQFVVRTFSGTFPMPASITSAVSFSPAIQIIAVPGPSPKLVVREYSEVVDRDAAIGESDLRAIVGQREGAAWSAIVSKARAGPMMTAALSGIGRLPSLSEVPASLAQRVVALTHPQLPGAPFDSAVLARLSHAQVQGGNLLLHGSVDRIAVNTNALAVCSVLRDGAHLTRFTFYALQSWSPTSELVSASWDFGDGATVFSQGQDFSLVVSHDFAGAGTYNVSLTVADALGQSARTTIPVVVGGTTIQISPSRLRSGDILETIITVRSGNTPLSGVEVNVTHDDKSINLETDSHGRATYRGPHALSSRTGTESTSSALGSLGWLTLRMGSMTSELPLAAIGLQEHKEIAAQVRRCEGLLQRLSTKQDPISAETAAITTLVTDLAGHLRAGRVSNWLNQGIAALDRPLAVDSPPSVAMARDWLDRCSERLSRS